MVTFKPEREDGLSLLERNSKTQETITPGDWSDKLRLTAHAILHT